MDNNFNNGQPYQQADTSVMTTGQWMLTTFLLALPCVGLILAFVWGFGTCNLNKKNYCRSWLIWKAIAIGVSLLISLLFAAMGV